MATRVAIMQPTYLPWLGYFDLMDQVDCLVLLDTVQFSHQSWQHRNRVRGPDGLVWLTVPVLTAGRLGQRILDVELRPVPFARKHIATLDQCYTRAPGAADLMLQLRPLLEHGERSGRLTELTVPVLEALARQFGVTTPLLTSSNMSATGRRSELLVSICEELGARHYVTVPGSLSYLAEESDIFRNHGISVSVHSYDHPEYRQRFSPFLAHVSAVDLLCNEPDAPSILRSGRRPLLPLDEAMSVHA
ncbi:MAG: WbqC family protein [Chloroflexi bacterium]|nr:MAG: WbqC family protein [Chloroflexota bacterium]